MTVKPISLRVFTNIWRETCSTIVIMRPKSDLCAFCQKHYTSGTAMALATLLTIPIQTSVVQLDKEKTMFFIRLKML